MQLYPQHGQKEGGFNYLTLCLEAFTFSKVLFFKLFCQNHRKHAAKPGNNEQTWRGILHGDVPHLPFLCPFLIRTVKL